MNRSYVPLLFMLIVILGAMAAFASVALEPQVASNAPEPTHSIPLENPTSDPPVRGTLGERVAASGVAVTATAVEWSSIGAEYPAAQNNERMIVHIVVENTSPADTLLVDPGDFSIVQPNGDLIKFDPIDAPDSLREDTSLGPGESITAKVVFDPPERRREYHLLYDFNDQHIDIDLAQ